MSKKWEAVHTYRTLAEPFEAEITERKSHFICHVVPVSTEDEALAVLADVRSCHPDARHSVWAYLLRDGRERCSDDGKPQKIAGLPSFEMPRRSELTDLVAVTTRYFGGTLLGTGGLVRAYTEAVQAALAEVSVAEHTNCVTAECRLPYARYEQVLRLAEDADGKSLGDDFGADVLLRVLFKESDAPAFAAAVRELSRGRNSASWKKRGFAGFRGRGLSLRLPVAGPAGKDVRVVAVGAGLYGLVAQDQGFVCHVARRAGETGMTFDIG